MIKRRISPRMNEKIERIPAGLLIANGDANKVSLSSQPDARLRLPWPRPEKNVPCLIYIYMNRRKIYQNLRGY